MDGDDGSRATAAKLKGHDLALDDAKLLELSRSLRLPAAEALLDILESEGVRFVFGVPGGPLTGLFEAMADRRRIRLVLAKHEGGAAFMAASYARVSGKLAVCCGTSGPGATNALTGVASAQADSLPVLFLSGQVSTGVFGKGAIQESSAFGIDLVQLFKPVTKLSAMLPSVDRIPDTIRAAIRTAMTGRPGAVHINMPADMLRHPVRHHSLQPEQYRVSAHPIDLDAIERAAHLLATAKRPYLLAGHGVALARASEALLDLARAFQIPVATSPKGKGVFPENHPLSLGVLGFGGHELAERYLRSPDLDLLLVIGSSLNEFVTDAWTLPLGASGALVQIDVDPGVIGRNFPVTVGVVGHAHPALRELTERAARIHAEALRAMPPSSHARVPVDPLRELKRQTPRYMAAESLESESSPLKPQRVIRELRAAMPDDALLFVDNGNSILWGTHYFEVRRPNTYFIDLGLASMGSAVAGVVGGALAAPGKRAVALVGDGAFAMNGFEVHTAVELRLPVVWVVLDNGGHGMVHQGDTLMKGRDLGVSLYGTPIDAAAMARSVGARGVRARTPAEFRAAITVGFEAERASVIASDPSPISSFPPPKG
jgi:acetolactate synthase-1/2/3 large subunit